METNAKKCCANFKIDIEDIKAIIAAYASGKNFDSHDVIQSLLKDFSSKYGELLQKHDNVTTANAEISNFLRRNDTILNITHTGKTHSVNIFGNVTECAEWEKL